ncbi:winged helix-turn-helix transcriptional regulator [Caulobacter sp. 73W]|uniref:Winged helix-turn-helix transcriptional regulator n=1 Tax=Caulobacter sp. 73W TaxID=3161137 RepID=A0AB39KRM7_9CAUL
MPADLRAAYVVLASIAFARDYTFTLRGDEEFLDTFIFGAIVDANFGALDAQPRLGVAFGDADSYAPEALRRPITTHAVAQSLSISPETARRRIKRLVQDGKVRVGPKGLIATDAGIASPTYKSIQMANYDRTAAFYRLMRMLGAAPAPSAEPAAGEAPLVRVVGRATSEYTLRRVQDLMDICGGVLGLACIGETIVCNLRDIDGPGLVNWIETRGATGRPVSTREVARGAKLPYETVRRQIDGLSKKGLIRKDRTGVVAVCPDTMIPTVIEAIQSNAIDLRRLFNRLDRAGVLSTWIEKA